MTNANHKFTAATLTTALDGNPVVTNYTIGSFIEAVRTAPLSATPYEAYHFHKAEDKRLGKLALDAKNGGDMEQAKLYKEDAKKHKTIVQTTKSGPAVMGFIFKNGIGYRQADNGFRNRDNTRVTHSSIILLDIESNTTSAEIHEVLKDFEYVLWTTITHRADDLRYRVVLFPPSPIPFDDAAALILRIDANLPNRNHVSKKTQNIDSASLDKGRLMYLPRWLSQHPLKYEFIHNEGKLITVDDFDVSEEQIEVIINRIKASEQLKANKSTAAIKTAATGDHPLIVQRKNKGKENDWLHPKAEFETEDGWITLDTVNGKLMNVTCPFHGDSNGSEFLAINNKSGRPQFVCHTCGTFKMFPGQVNEDHDDGKPSTLSLKKKDGTTHNLNEIQSANFEAIREQAKSFTPSVKPLLDYTDKDTVYTFNDRYLPDISELLPNRGIVVIRSPKGTGKTELLAKVVTKSMSEGRSTMLLTHRRSLADALSVRTGLTNYQNLKAGAITDNIVICVNSLNSRLTDLSDAYDYIIIDESEQVFRNLLSSTLKSVINDVFNKIIWLLQNAKRIICLDADLTSDLTIEMIVKMRGGLKEKDDVMGIINEYKIGKGQKTEFYADQYQIIGDAMEAVERGEKVFIASSTAKMATVLAEVCKSMEKRVLLLTAETTGTAEAEAFRQSPSTEAQHYDVVLASPTLSTGVSIDGEYFDHVFGIFKTVEGITYQDYDQAISRVRSCPHFAVWIQPFKPKEIKNADGSFSHYTSPVINTLAHYRDEAVQREIKTSKRLLTDISLNEVQKMWVDIESMIKVMVDEWSAYRDLQFKAMRSDLGFEIIDIAEDKEQSDLGRLLYTAFKDVGVSQAAVIFAARDLDYDEAEKIGKTRNKTNEEYLAYRKYSIARLIDAPLTLELVEKALDQNLIYALSKLKTQYVIDDEERVKIDLKDREKNKTTFTVSKHRAMKTDLLNYLARQSNLDLQSIFDTITSGRKFDITNDVLKDVAEAYELKQREFNFYFTARIKNPSDPKNYKKIWDATFGETYSLPLMKERKQIAGTKSMFYHLDNTKNDLVMAALEDLQARGY